MFILVHVTGSNNAKYSTPEDPADEDCPATLSDAIDPGCYDARAEYEARNTVVNKFVRTAFTVATAKKLAGVMLVIQANIFGDDATDGSVSVTDGFTDFWDVLQDEAQAFGGPVVLVHGDSHLYRELIPNTSIPNLSSIMVPGSSDIGWVEADIDASSVVVFSFTHIDLVP